MVDDEYVIEEIFRIEMDFARIFYIIEMWNRVFYMMKTNNSDKLKTRKNRKFVQEKLKTKQKSRLIHKHRVCGIVPSKAFSQ